MAENKQVGIFDKFLIRETVKISMLKELTDVSDSDKIPLTIFSKKKIETELTKKWGN